MSVELFAGLAWYDEPAAWLHAHIEGLARADVSHLVALDGAYEHFEGGETSSPPEQWAAIDAACTEHGIDYTAVRAKRLWRTEVEKRAELFWQILQYAPDWLIVLDTDEVIRSVPDDLHALLEQTPLDAAECVRLEAGVPDSEPRRCMFRAIPGLTVQDAHYCYVTPDGRDLWGRRDEPALAVHGMVIDHRKSERPAERNARQESYYRNRNRLRLERFP